MKAAVFYGKGDIRVVETALREPKADEVLVRVAFCGICGTDMHIYSGAPGATECSPPVVLGHEFSGTVERVGSAVTAIKAGDRVAVDPNTMCGSCVQCRRGRPHFCGLMTATGVNTDGGFAQYCTVLEKQVYLLPKELPLECGALCEPVSCCIHGIDNAKIELGDTVLIIGGGPIGQIMLQLARNAGAARVALSEPVAQKRELALSLGADFVIDPSVQSISEAFDAHGADRPNVVIECCGTRSGISDAIKSAGKGATIVLFSVASPELELPIKPYDIFARELHITSSFVNPNTFGRAVDVIASGALKLEPLLSETISLEQLDAQLNQGKASDKVLVSGWK